MSSLASRIFGRFGLSVFVLFASPVLATDLGIQRGGIEQMQGLGFDPDSSAARYLHMNPEERKAAFSPRSRRSASPSSSDWVICP